MKLDLDTPVWYSKDSMYVSTIKDSDIVLLSEAIDMTKENQDIQPKDTEQSLLSEIATVIHPQINPWFSTKLTKEQVEKRIHLKFSAFNYKPESKWVKFKWVPKYLQVQSKGFYILFSVDSYVESNPRIPLAFLESVTPRATSPTDVPKGQIRNIVLHPGAGPDIEQIDDIPMSEQTSSFEINDGRSKEKHKLRQAKLRVAIARLRLEEMKERYLHHYGAEEVWESSESEEDDSVEDEFSETNSKNL